MAVMLTVCGYTTFAIHSFRHILAVCAIIVDLVVAIWSPELRGIQETDP